MRSQGHDLIAVTKTWWDSLHDCSTVVDGCVLFREDRPERRGGGAAFYVREQLERIDLCLGVEAEPVKSLQGQGQANMGVSWFNPGWQPGTTQPLAHPPSPKGMGRRIRKECKTQGLR